MTCRRAVHGLFLFNERALVVGADHLDEVVTVLASLLFSTLYVQNVLMTPSPSIAGIRVYSSIDLPIVVNRLHDMYHVSIGRKETRSTGNRLECYRITTSSRYRYLHVSAFLILQRAVPELIPACPLERVSCYSFSLYCPPFRFMFRTLASRFSSLEPGDMIQQRTCD